MWPDEVPYGYAASDPLRWTDPSGKKATCRCCPYGLTLASTQIHPEPQVVVPPTWSVPCRKASAGWKLVISGKLSWGPDSAAPSCWAQWDERIITWQGNKITSNNKSSTLLGDDSTSLEGLQWFNCLILGPAPCSVETDPCTLTDYPGWCPYDSSGNYVANTCFEICIKVYFGGTPWCPGTELDFSGKVCWTMNSSGKVTQQYKTSTYCKV
jgi:hypothetical protein